jgi:tetratricopeptide (TPR) repeat protein
MKTELRAMQAFHWERSRRSLAVRPVSVPPFVIWLLVAFAVMLLSMPRMHAQDPLATARSLYASAAYDEALKTLQQLSSSDTPLTGSNIREVEEYRFLCLLALGRNSEAKESITAVVTADPLYKLDENTTSPRVMNAFRSVRREVLPDVLSNIYNAAKGMYDQKNFAGAEPQFRKVLALVGDPDLQGKGADLQTLAKGFLDLAVAALKPAESAAPTAVAAGGTTPGAGAVNPAGGTSPAAAPAGGTAVVPKRTEIVATQAKAGEIVPPRVLKQALPNVPSDLSRFGQLRPGELELLIDETGKVQEARFVRPIHPVYDSLVIAATRSWRYEPARADGIPVKFRKNIRVTIAEGAREQQQ